MRILITNDDGIHADGLEALEKIAAQLSDDVWVIAPDSDQSGVAHSLSLNDPLRLRKINAKRYAVRGTPTDCVIMAIRHVMADNRPDLVLSGINRGHNVAEDVTYSGTIAGAMEGTILGVPSIALSQGYPFRDRDAIRYDYAVEHGAAIIRRVLEVGIEKGILININFPGVPPQDVKGIKVTVQGQRDQSALLNIVKRADGRHLPYYWLAFNPQQFEPKEGTDLHAVRDGYISITPLRLDLTDMPSVTRFAEALEK
jgi:5'-nucleotidase